MKAVAEPRRLVLVVDKDRSSRAEMASRLMEIGYEVVELDGLGHEPGWLDRADVVLIRRETQDDTVAVEAGKRMPRLVIRWTRRPESPREYQPTELDRANANLARILSAIAASCSGWRQILRAAPRDGAPDPAV
jgi:hypothetical protein